MPVITLPGSIRDTITRALGQDLQNRIARGRAAADITFHVEAGSPIRNYRFDLKSNNGKVLATWQGSTAETDRSGPIPLFPDVPSATVKVANAVHVGDGGLFLFHRQAEENAGNWFRVEFKPPGSSAVYMALEGKGDEGAMVTMEPAELYPSRA